MRAGAFRRSVVCVAAIFAAGCQWLDDRPARPAPPPYVAAATFESPTYSRAHQRVGDIVRDFLGRRPTPTQPLEFPHRTHIQNGLACVECHESVERGPIAGLPTVNTCLFCHREIATDRPRIQQVTAWRAQGLDIAWQRVYGYPAEAHVRFNHAPHVRAGVACEQCHGDLEQQTVARRVVDLNMGACVTCHRARHAPDGCETCHF